MKLIGCALLFIIWLCPIFAQSQAELNVEAGHLLEASESRLQQTILTIRGLYHADPLLLQRMDDSQQAWLVYRAKQMAMILPKHNEPGAYGTAFSLCWSTWMTKLTNQRTSELQIWVEGIEQGEACSGSIRVR